jgi:hypothetical protein
MMRPMTDEHRGSCGRPRALAPLIAAALLGCPAPDAPGPTRAPETPRPASAPATRPASAPPATPSSSPAAAAPDRTALGPASLPASRPPPGPGQARLREVATRTLNGEPYAGHVLELDYSIAATPEAGGHRVAVTVHRVTVDARVEDYRLRLDSDRAADRTRVAGGAETTTSPDTARAFALLDRPLVIHVGPNGDARGVEGQEAVAAQLIAAHPPALRAAADTAGRVAWWTGHAALAALLLPGSELAPAEGALEPGRRVDEDRETDLGPVLASRARATLVQARPDGAAGVRLRSKAILKPRDGVGRAPPPAGRSIRLRTGRADGTVDLGPDGLFEAAGSEHEEEQEWTWPRDGADGTDLVHIARTRVWTRGR